MERVQIVGVIAGICCYVLGKEVSWTELTPLENFLHYADFPNKTVPTSIACIALGSSTTDCTHVTYSTVTSQCVRHSTLRKEAHRPDISGRVWQKRIRCPRNFFYNADIGNCIYQSADSVNWYTALYKCRTLNSRLLVATTKHKLAAIANTSWAMTTAWVGGVVPSTGRAKWITGEPIDIGLSDFVYTSSTNMETCVSFWFKNRGDMTASNMACGKKTSYICEAM